ncbi:MAG: hypothetical protein DRH24_00785 [Deltaproteobacteria bacterium]|nr:MAG: hypothetical protein DRH24_00785 [Deltaproteobacteria bacterium]
MAGRHKGYIYYVLKNLVLWASGSESQVRVFRLCPGVLCLKSQNSSTKLQINLKFQYSMTKTFQDETLFGI